MNKEVLKVRGEDWDDSTVQTEEVNADGESMLEFRKHPTKVVKTVLETCELVNSSFDEPFATTGDMLRFLAEVSDKLDERALHDHENVDQENS